MYRTTDGSNWTQITVLGPVPGATPSSSPDGGVLPASESGIVSNDAMKREASRLPR